MNIELSIVVPCYNEEKNIPLILNKFVEVLENKNIELILVNNGSTDNSAEIFKKELANFNNSRLHVVTIKKNIGYGHGIITGLKKAKGNLLAWTHADLQTDPKDILTGFNILKKSNNKQIIIKGHRIKRKFGDWFFTLGMSVVASCVLQTMLSDINAQPKIFPRSFYSLMKKAPQNYSLDLYLLYLAKKHKYKIVEFPVLFKKRIHGESKWAYNFRSKISTIWRTVKYIFKLTLSKNDTQ